MDSASTPGDPIDALNIWRLTAGHRLAWARPPRHNLPSKCPILSVIDLRECALVAGDNARASSDLFFDFGALTKPEQTREEIVMSQEAVRFVREMGVPRTIAFEWKIG